MLKVDGIVKRYNSAKVLDQVDFLVSPGEIVTVLGPSGSGKTTLLRIIAGFETPDSGKIWLGDVEASLPGGRIPPHERNISMIFQDLALWPHMTAAASLKFVLRNRRLPKAEINSGIAALLAMVDLNGHEQRYPHELSGGERQRLAIARAFASDPAYMLMDEPFSNLDHLLIAELSRVVRDQARQRGTGILYVTHHIKEALALSDRLAIMRQGRLEQFGGIDEVISHPRNEFVKRFLKV